MRLNLEDKYSGLKNFSIGGYAYYEIFNSRNNYQPYKNIMTGLLLQ